MEFSEIGDCGDTDVDPPDVVILTEGGRPGHTVRVAIDEGIADTARHVVLTELGDGVRDVLVEMSVWVVAGPWISSSFEREIDDYVKRAEACVLPPNMLDSSVQAYAVQYSRTVSTCLRF